MSTTHTSLLWIPVVTVQSSFLVASENCFRFNKGACVSFSPPMNFFLLFQRAESSLKSIHSLAM